MATLKIDRGTSYESKKKELTPTGENTPHMV